jgi:hypothetical protein
MMVTLPSVAGMVSERACTPADNNATAVTSELRILFVFIVRGFVFQSYK